MGIQLDSAPQDLDGFIDLVKPIVNSAEIDEGAGPAGVEAGYFPEVIDSILQLTNQEAYGGKSIVNVGRIGLHAQRLQIDLPGFFVFILRNRLSSLGAKA